MNLFKALRGKRNNLPENKTDGNLYFCTDDQTLHVDYKNEDGTVVRGQINAKDAETLSGAFLSTTLNDYDGEVPSSKAVYDELAKKSDTNHNHDDKYYTEAEVDNQIVTLNSVISGKANEVHDHNGIYYTETEIDSKVSDLNNLIGTKENAGTAENIVSVHNTETSAHNDIRDLINGLTTRLNALADSDDTTLDQLSEIVAYIKSNKTLIDAITTSKVNVSDIINNLTTNVTNKPLSAAQGVAIKVLIDTLQTELDAHKANKSNPHAVTISQLGLTATVAELNIMDGVTATTAEINKLGGLTATTAELNYVDGVKSNIQAQIDTKVSKSGDIMAGGLQFNMANPHIHMKDTGYSTDWYFQAYQDQLAFGPTFATAVKTDKNGNMTVPGSVNASVFKSGETEAAIKPSDSNEINFGSNANYIYFGYENRVGSSGKVDTYKFGTHSGVDGASSGNIECGSVKVGSTKMTYDSTNECLNFAFV